MAKVFSAFADGWGRVLRAPAILLGVLALTWVLAYSTVAVRDYDALEHGGFGERVRGPATGFYPTYTPTLLGTERFIRDVRGYLRDRRLTVDVAAASATTLFVWTFLLGGILDRYARRRPIRTQAFFGASGVFFFRFLRLGVVAALGYVVLFGVVHPLLFPPDYPWVAEGSQAGQASPLLTPVYAVFLMFATFWSAVVDYARIRAVVEDRRSMLGAILAAWRFVTAHPLKTFGLYLLNAALFGALLWASLVAMRGGVALDPGAPVIAFFFVGRVVLKLVFFASQTALFQRSLAHVEYTAAPELLWPESPAAEAIINAAPRIPPDRP
jgi:hypothetical protein